LPKKVYKVVSHYSFFTVHFSYLKLVTKDLSLVRAAREVVGSRLGSSRVAKDTSPLLDGLVVVLDVESGVGGSVVDLHLGASSVVARVHVLDNVGPLLLSPSGLALRASRVPSGGLVSLALEATSRDTSVDNCRGENIGVGSSHDVLILLVPCS
jgi:hypothetical protein